MQKFNTSFLYKTSIFNTSIKQNTFKSKLGWPISFYKNRIIGVKSIQSDYRILTSPEKR